MTDSSTAGLAAGLPAGAVTMLWFVTVFRGALHEFTSFIIGFSPLLWLLPDELVWVLKVTGGVGVWAFLGGVTVGILVAVSVKTGVIIVRGRLG